ncbi:amino acid adenylation domain-containing protein [Paenibacillus caseinilyticus]|uniref:Fusaricidin synthetase n=1 Tax=Paenibacillus mucilaginosus K02 TaxID=997761 RepID=I0BMM5_9BACL|nr:non-ribosomal peptide synthetase [Paenibacillus mucilaginosus]AFH63622.2 fusaricidin synthetase [Paenibacillus mucilaginosus K02]
MKKARAYWNGAFQKGQRITCLPYSKADWRSAGSLTPAAIGASESTVPQAVSERIRAVTQGTPAAVYTLLVAAVSCLLHRYTQEETVIVAAPAVRTAGSRQLNDVILYKLPVDGTASFRTFLGQVSGTVREAVANQNVAFQAMAGELDVEYTPEGAPVLHTLVSFDRMNPADASESIVSDLQFRFTETEEALKLDIVYHSGLYEEEAVVRMAKHLYALMAEALGNPSQELGVLEMMSEEERGRILGAFNDTVAEYPQEATIISLFEEQAARTPERTAVLFEDASLTYGELNARANALARTLQAAGIGPDARAAVMTERSLEMIVGIYAILKAGGAYVPVAPDYPEERIRYILEDSGSKVLLTQERFLSGVPQEYDGVVVNLNDPNVYSGEESNLVPAAAGPQDAAYVIYTSGSTGKPKGVLIEHTSAVNRILWMHEKYPIGADDTILQKTAFTFDVSVWELFWWGMVGSKVCLLTPGGEKNPAQILEAIERYSITTMHFVPAMLHTFLDYAEGLAPEVLAGKLASLTQVFASGEALPPQHVARFQASVSKVRGARLINLYGPTEATVDVSYFDCEPDQPYAMVPIGRPVWNTRLYVMKEGTTQLQPVGVAGELCIAGVQVARGYLNRPELNAEKFAADPLVPGARMYRTGDLTRWLPDGNIEYLGRIDHQVKIRGYRIELGEVESAVLDVEGVLEAVVTAREDETGQKLLCAYYVADRELAAGGLREALTAQLPSYMVPTYFVQLERMPLSANGKIDRKLLPAPEASVQSASAYVAPRTELEAKLAAIWAEVLGLPQVGVTDHFLDIGGHSLRAAAVVARVHKELGRPLALRDMFRSPTVEALAAVIESMEEAAYTAIPAAEPRDYYPLSSAQKRLYLLSHLQGGETGYNMPGVILAEGALDRARLQQAFEGLISRHESLRTRFEMVQGEPVQRIVPHSQVPFRIEEWEASEEEAAGLIEAFVRPFDLAEAPLLRVGLITLTPERHLLLFDMHHIISDGVSLSVLVEEFARFYQGLAPAPLRIQYKDYAVWEQDRLQSELLRKQEAFWLDQFRGELPTLDLPADYVRPAVQSFEGGRIEFRIGSEAVSGLKQLAARSGSTLFMVLLAAYTALLHKYTGQEDVVVGVPVAGRGQTELEPIIGMFVNTLAIRQAPASEKTFLGYLGEVKEGALAAFEHGEYPFEALVEKLQLKRDLSRSPLFDTMFELKHAAGPEPQLEGLRFTPYPGEHKTSKFDLSLEAMEAEDGGELRCSFEYAASLFRPETVERMACHLVQLVESAVRDPESKLSELGMVTEYERSQLLDEFNPAVPQADLAEPFHLHFERQAQLTPDHPAVGDRDRTLTYRELDQRAGALAARLRKLGVGREKLVGILAERSVDLLVAVLAIWKAGGAYVPLDPDYPAERIAYMLEDSGAEVLLTQSGLSGPFAEAEAAGEGLRHVLHLDDESVYESGGEALRVGNINEPQDLAYVIYTSGTTGRPKGVMIEHRSLVNTALAYRREYRLTEFPVRLLQLASFSFDVFTGDIARTLLNGGTMFICPKEDRIDPERLYGWIRDRRITMFESTPALIIPFMEHAAAGGHDVSSLQLLITSSDACGVRDYRNLQMRFGGQVRIINAYGVTEAAIDSSFYDEPLEKLPASGNVPIGRAYLNARFYIVDSGLKPVPVGVAGELCIGGPGVARGYLNRPDLTAEKFVENPFCPGERMYRSGDLARWMADGHVDFIGRIDHQVKIRGYRIELGEIETAMLRYPGVRQAVVIDRTDERGQKYLCGYAAGDEGLDLGALQRELQQTLPSHMVPSRFLRLDRLPLTPNGKIDRKALPVPEAGSAVPQNAYAAPRNAVEETLVSIWQGLLGGGPVGIHDSFFELGGDSIKALQVSSRLYQAGYRLEMKDLFQHPTAAALSPLIRPLARMADQGEVSGEVPLTPIQRWFFEQRYADAHHHNQAVMLYRPEGFDEEALRRAAAAIAVHHDTLRTIYREAGDGTAAWNRSTAEGELFSLEVVSFEASEDLAARVEAEAERVQASIDLENGPLFKLGLFRCPDGDHLLIAVHHLVVDGVSWRILFEDLTEAYGQAAGGEAVRLPAKTDAFRTWAEGLMQYADSPAAAREHAYWQELEQLERAPLPKDAVQPDPQHGDNEKVTVQWTPEETELLLKGAHHAYGTEINDLLLTALGMAVHRWSGLERIWVTLEGHGREAILPDLDISRTVGWFTSQYPVALEMPADAETGQRIKEVKETLRGVPGKGIGYGIWRYLSEAGRSSDAFQPEPEIAFNYLGQFDEELESGAFSVSPYGAGREISPRAARTYPLEINGLTSGGSLYLTLSYSRGQYRQETIEGLAGELQRCLSEILAHCAARQTAELTPSDLTLRGMTIPELEELVRSTAEIGEVEDAYLLTPMQQGMLFHALMDANSGAYFEQSTFDLLGHFDLDKFELSVESLVRRHEIFRSNVYTGWRERPLQVIFRSKTGLFRRVDLRGMSGAEQQEAIGRITREDQERGFDLTRDPLMRVTVLRTGDESYRFIWSTHHILMDGWCLSLVTEEVFEYYGALLEGREPKLAPVTPYSRYAEWLEEQDKEQASGYWAGYLAGYETQTLLPTGRPQGRVQDQTKDEAFRSRYCDFSRELTAGMDRFAKRHGVTLNTLLQTVWGLLLQRYNGTGDVVFGSVVSGRPAEIPGIESMVGLFINTIPVRIRCSGEETFSEMLRRSQEAAAAGYAYETHPLFEIQALTEQKQELIGHIVVFENFPVEEQVEQLGSGDASDFRIVNAGMVEQTNYDFNLIVTPGEQLRIRFEYNESVFDPSAVERISGHLQHLMGQVVADAERKVNELEVVTPAEKETIFGAFNDTAVPSPKEKTIHRLLEEQAELTPEAEAVVYEGERLTYRELNGLANRLARRLREAGVGRETLVGLMAERSLEMFVGLFGILKAGGAYVPIDPEYPEERIRYMLEDSGTKVLLTQSRLEEQAADAGTVLLLDEEGTYHEDESNLEPLGGADDLAYVIYTSGTTGKPKGVMVEHHGLTNLKVYFDQVLKLGAQDKIVQFASLSFDAACWEIYGALFTGAALYVPASSTILNYRLFEQYMQENGITMAALPPTYAVYLEPDTMPALRILFTAGSASSVELVGKWKDRLAYYNGYGPTENSIATTIWPVSEDPDADKGIVSIGRPMPNQHVYVIDPLGHLAPVGVAGELCVAGAGLARGYLDRPELTDEKFVVSRFSGERMYRTGDLARWMEDGRLEYLGRIDHQVKIRGYRIELGEIEAQLLKSSSVQETIVLAREDGHGQQELCAYFVAEELLRVSELRALLAAELPGYMVPTHFMQLEAMPLTPNGKIDRKALPAPEAGGLHSADYHAPRTWMEARLAEMYQQVLGVSSVGVNESFFELGGHSLKATALVSLLHKELGMNVPLKEVFRAPTVEALAEVLSGREQSAYVSIPAAEAAEVYPLSSAQQRMYVLHELEGDHLTYNMPAMMSVEGRLDKDRLQEVFRKLIARHEALRTSFELAEGEPVQRIHAEVPFEVEYRQADDITAGELAARFVRPFDLTRAPLLRVGLVEMAPERFLLLFDTHHIVSDGASMSLLTEEFVRLYEGEALSPLRIQYKDYAAWQQAELQSERMRGHEAFWLDRFSGELPVLAMPTDHPRPAGRAPEGETVAFELGAARSEALRKLAAANGSTLFMTLLAAYTVLLHKYTGQEDIVVGTPVAGRPHADLEPVLGMFVNTLALRHTPAPGKTFRSYLKEVRDGVLQAFEHQDYPFEDLVDRLNLERDLSRSPLFDTLFVMQNADDRGYELPGLLLKPYPREQAAAQFDLTFEAAETPEGLACSFQFASALYKRASIERLAEHFLQLLDGLTQDPQVTLGEADLVTVAERAQILGAFNDTAAEYPREATIISLFEEQAARTPERTAVLFEDTVMTYGELNARANALARTLRSAGVGPDTRAAVMAERSIEMIVGIYAVLKAGGAYVPVAPDYPAERISYILEDSDAAVLLTQERFLTAVPEPYRGVTVNLNDPAVYGQDESNLVPAAGPHHIAYVIYTSGSTGRPKGVMIEHHSAVNRILWMDHKYGIGPEDTILHKTAFTFDVSVWELFWWGMVGSKVCLLTPGGEKNPSQILEAIERYGITTMHFVPAMLHTFLEYAEGLAPEELAGTLASLRQVFASGEALPPQSVARFQAAVAKLHGARLINLYGPTEATVDVSYFDCEPDGTYGMVPIGRPVWNTQLYILKEGTTRLQPVGVAGELCIAGVQVARGYLNRPELNAEKFVADPFTEGGRMYRTGDLARWLPDGNIEYLGRIDHQVKIRGYRIELGEVESAVLDAEGVLEAVVTAREDETGQKLLCAYYVADRELTAASLREALSARLPGYMVPTYFVQLERMPLSGSGKVDRKRLPAPEASVQSTGEYTAPRTQLEAKLAEIWAAVLRLPQVGVTDNFFEIGGHSLRATTLTAKIRQELGRTVPLREIFQSPTVESLARVLSGMDEAGYAAIPAAPESEYYPVTSAQKRMFILAHLEGGELSYNMPGVFTVEGPLDRGRLEGAFRRLIARHESLRTGFEMRSGEVVQKVYGEVPFELECMQADEAAADTLVRAFVRPFRLDEPPLLRAGLIELAPGRHILMYDTHHIISDGVSSEVMMDELAQFYDGRTPAPLTIQYKDYAVWQQAFVKSERYRQEERYWLDTFAGDLPVLDLPIAYPRPAVRSFEGALYEFEVEQEVTGRLRELAKASGATMYMVLLAAYSVLLSKYSGQEDIIVGTPTAGRQLAELEPLIGMFVGTVALRQYPRRGLTFLDYLSEVKENALQAFEYQGYPFDELVDRLELERDPSRHPLFDTLLVYAEETETEVKTEAQTEARGDEAGAGQDLTFIPYGQEHQVAKFDLSLSLTMKGDQLYGSAEYAVKLFGRSAVEKLVQDLLNLLDEAGREPQRRLEELGGRPAMAMTVDDLRIEAIDFSF